MTPTPDSANTLVYVSWNQGCDISRKVWKALHTQCKGFHDTPSFSCVDRNDLDRDFQGQPLKTLVVKFRLVVILLSAEYSNSPRWWVDEVKELLIPTCQNRQLTWQQIAPLNVPSPLAGLVPLSNGYPNQWTSTKLDAFANNLSKKILQLWQEVPTFSKSLPEPQMSPAPSDAPPPALPISHVALVISPPGNKEGRRTYDFALYHRQPTDTSYELLTQIRDARGTYPLPWATSTNTEADQLSSPGQTSPSCPVLERLLEWAQRQNHRFVLEIFAPLALLQEPWGHLLVPLPLGGKREVLVKARPFLLRSWERLHPDFNSYSDYLKEKYHHITSGQPWTWMDECTFQPDNLSNHQSDPSHVAVHRATPLASQDQAHWLHAVVNSMVPLALWPHSPPPPRAPDPPTGTAPPDPHTTVLDQCLQALQTSPTHSSWPDLDRLAQLRFTARPAALRHYAILVDHPTRRPPPDVSSTDDLMISP